MAEDRLCLVMNLGNQAVTQYQEYNFNSMCKFGEVYLGANESGIFILDSGDTDAPSSAITAYFELFYNDFGIPNFKRVRSLYFGLETDGDLSITLSSDNAGSETYTVDPTYSTEANEQARIRCKRSQKGRYVKIKVSNKSGSNFRIDAIDVLLVILGGKQRGS